MQPAQRPVLAKKELKTRTQLASQKLDKLESKFKDALKSRFVPSKLGLMGIQKRGDKDHSLQ